MAFSKEFLEEYASMKIALGLLEIELWALLFMAFLVVVILIEYRKWRKSKAPKKDPKPRRKNGLLFSYSETEVMANKFRILPKEKLVYLVFELAYREKFPCLYLIVDEKGDLISESMLSFLEGMAADAWHKIEEGKDRESVIIEVKDALDALVEEKMDDT